MKNYFKKICLILLASILSFTMTPYVAGSNYQTVSNTEAASLLTGDAVTADKLDNAIVLFVGSPVSLVNNKEVQVDTANRYVTPVIRNNRALVPIRFIAGNFGADVQWDAKTSTVTVKLGAKTTSMVIGSDKMYVGGNEIVLDCPAQIINDKTFIPLRQLSTALGKKIFYDRGLIIISDIDDIFDASQDRSTINKIISRVNNLPVVGSFDGLKELMSKAQENYTYSYGVRRGTVNINNLNMVKTEGMPAPDISRSEDQKTDEAAALASKDYSPTNIQVAGVNESDLVKTDGEYIYQIDKHRVMVTKAYPAENMEVISKIEFDDQNFSPQSLYLEGPKLVVIGTCSNFYQKIDTQDSKISNKIMPPINNKSIGTRAIVFDISDKSKIDKLREVEIEGNYVDSRMIGTNLYFISNRYMNYYYIQSSDFKSTPLFRDTAVKDEYVSIDYPEIRYFPEMVDSNYMLIASFDVEKQEQKANISTFLGIGQNIYASKQNLYVCVNKYKIDNLTRLNSESMIRQNVENNTAIYKFALDNGSITYLCKAEIPGRILNQFSMDENNKCFRVATTVDNVFDGKNYISQNNLYILDELLNITGKIENIAPGEKIYSTRFMGDKGYIVTYRTVDPLFVIDLKDPNSPKILGQLKIPGYSEYLHPYDENHIIGFGKDTVELPQKDWTGKDTGKTAAYYLGLKIAVFDITDVNNPVEMFKENIGDRGTDSEILRDQKALLFSKEKNLLAFPVMLMELKNKSGSASNSAGIPEYGEFTFQGEYVYSLDLVNGFKLKGRITHLTDDDYKKAGTYGYDSDKNVGRAIYINDMMYTMSNEVIKANKLVDLSEIKTLNLQ